MWPKSQDVEQKQHCNEFSEDFKGGPHHNIVKKKKKRWKKKMGEGPEEGEVEEVSLDNP